jgi:hypothetical protein
MSPPDARLRTWQVRCVRCGGDRWPYQREEPVNYVCARCLGTAPARQEAARRTARAAAESRRKRRVVSSGLVEGGDSGEERRQLKAGAFEDSRQLRFDS